MATINMRPQRLIPDDCVPGDGLVSGTWDELTAIGQTIAQMPADEATGTVQKPAIAACKGIAGVEREHWKIADDIARKLNDPSNARLVTQAQNAAVSALATSGWGAPQDLWAAQGSERARVLRAAQAEVAAAVIESRREKTAAAAKGAVDSVVALQAAIEEAVADFEAPSALKDNIELVDLQRRVDVEQELLAHGDEAMAFALQAIDRACGIGDEKKRAERLKNLIPACMRAANTILSTPQPKLAQRREARHDGRQYAGQFDDRFHVAAKKVLARITQYKESQRPQSITIAENALNQLRPVFEAVLGRSAEFMTSFERAKLYEGDGSQIGPQWSVDPAWPGRYVVGSRFGKPLGGWSRIVGIDRSIGGRNGFPVRAPAAVAPLVVAEVRGMR